MNYLSIRGWVFCRADRTTHTHTHTHAQVNNNALSGLLPTTISMLGQVSGRMLPSTNLVFGSDLLASHLVVIQLTILHLGYNNMSGYVPELPSSLDAEGTSVTFYGPGQEFWCPFPSSDHDVYDSMDCTCESAHRCPSGFDKTSYFSNAIGDRIDACEHNCTLCGAGEYSNGACRLLRRRGLSSFY